MKHSSRYISTLPMLVLCALSGAFAGTLVAGTATRSYAATEQQVPLTISGGHDTDPRDRGRPVVLVAAGLGVTADVFRNAFHNVHPAPPGQRGPTPEEARQNKAVLLGALSKYGVTNERLDEVSNFYRYRREREELWRHTSAAGYAIVRNGNVISVRLSNAGAGYSSTPEVRVPGYPNAGLKVKVSYGTELATNGSLSVTAVP
jgi:hypothetical protein